MNIKPFLIKVPVIVCLLSWSIYSSAQTIHYVKPAATGTGDGSSWANASAGIQAMLNGATAGDEIWVAAGIYYPSQEPDGTTDSPRDFSFFLQNGIKLYGGFAGTETTISQRVPAANVSTLSGDVGVPYDFADNAFHVVLSVANNAATLVDGFNIVKGNANVADSVMIAGVAVFRNKGGAMCNYNSSITIRNINCDTSIANFGAGMYNNASSPTISNCSFAWNSSLKGGGGMCNDNVSSPNISNSIFDNNYAHPVGGIGGGMYNINSSPTINNVVFSNHTAGLKGGGMFNIYSSPSIFNSFFYGNNCAYKAGGMYNMYSSPTINNCAFIKNGASYGAVICNDSASSPVITNSTFGNNGGAFNCDGILNLANSSPTLKNCIVLKSPGANPWLISKVITDSGNSVSSITYSDIDEGYPGLGNVDIKNPQFVNPANAAGPDSIFGTADDGYRLQNCSPLINAGDNIGVAATDITGATRIQLGITDMGAYESSSNTTDTSAAITATNSSITLAQAANGLTVYSNDCNSLIAAVKGDGTASSVNGNVTARIWIENQLPFMPGRNEPYAARHFEILPATNPAASSGRITLYFSLQDFESFNAFANSYPPYMQLPTDPYDAAGKANLRVVRYNGSSNDGSGLIETYTSGGEIINPADNDINWKAAENRWEVSFNVTAFGGFFLQRSLAVVPVKWISINALLTTQNEVSVRWKVQEQQVRTYYIEQSEDGIHFITIGNLASKGAGENNYSFTTTVLQTGNYFYRIRQTGTDGNIAYSSVIRLQNSNIGPAVSIYPNPAHTTANMQLTLKKAGVIQYRLQDNSGRILLTNKLLLNSGSTIIPVPIGLLSPGTYLVNVTGESFIQQLKLVKQ